MKITGSSTVEYIEVEGHDYERTGCGTWAIRMGESMEPVYDPDDLEQQYHEVASNVLPVEFVCFSKDYRPRKFKRSDSGDSYNCWIWNREWVWYADVSEDTAKMQFKDSEVFAVRRKRIPRPLRRIILLPRACCFRSG